MRDHIHQDWSQMAAELDGAIKEVRLGTPKVIAAVYAMA